MVDAGQFSERPEHRIPSIVGLSFHRARDDSPVNIAALFQSLSTQIGETLPDRKIHVFCVFPAEGECGIAHSLIESQSAFFEDARRKPADLQWCPVFKTDCDDLFAGLMVIIGDNFVPATFDKGITLRIKLNKVFFCPLK